MYYGHAVGILKILIAYRLYSYTDKLDCIHV